MKKTLLNKEVSLIIMISQDWANMSTTQNDVTQNMTS